MSVPQLPTFPNPTGQYPDDPASQNYWNTHPYPGTVPFVPQPGNNGNSGPFMVPGGWHPPMSAPGSGTAPLPPAPGSPTPGNQIPGLLPTDTGNIWTNITNAISNIQTQAGYNLGQAVGTVNNQVNQTVQDTLTGVTTIVKTGLVDILFIIIIAMLVYVVVSGGGNPVTATINVAKSTAEKAATAAKLAAEVA